MLEVLSNKPALLFVSPHNAADDQVIGTVVIDFRGRVRELTRLTQNGAVALDQSFQLTRDRFPSARCTRDPRLLNDIGSER